VVRTGISVMGHKTVTSAREGLDRQSGAPSDPPVTLRLTAAQHNALRMHLYPGDGREAVALALCGNARGPGPAWPEAWGSGRRAMIVHRVVPIPHGDCVRTPVSVTWPTERLVPLLEEAARRGFTVLKLHSHPGDFRQFSSVDDVADRELFEAVGNWLGETRPHVSAVMLPDGRLFARTVTPMGAFGAVDQVQVTGDDIWIWAAEDIDREWTSAGIAYDESEVGPGEDGLRTAQAFGAGTLAQLRRLSVAVVGASGTGSPTVEMLARLGVRELVLIDDDRVERKNLGRILNATEADAATDRAPGALKVEVLARAVRAMGLGTQVVALSHSLWHPDVVRRVAQCDVVFGCMDGYDGRDLLNRLATYYGLPYFDAGVRLDADGRGGVTQICGTIHYLQPGGSSLISRGVFTRDDVRAGALRRTDPETYRDMVRAKYLRGINEERPAVISINMLIASLGVNELLARLHAFRDDGNADYASFGISLTQARLVADTDGEPCPALVTKVGRGDVRPLLDTPELSYQPAGTP